MTSTNILLPREIAHQISQSGKSSYSILTLIARVSTACSLAICVVLLVQAPAETYSTASNPNVEVLDLGPAPQTGGFAAIRMTEDHRNVAIAGASGSRMAAYLNGKAGEKYDQIQTSPPVLSPDGRHWAYGARKGNDWFMVLDEKEFGPYTGFPPYGGLPGGGAQPIPFQLTPNKPIVFSPDSKHIAFVADKGTQMVVVEDGKEITPPGIQVDTTASLIFSRQGDHLAFFVRDATSRCAVILDGVMGPKYGAVYRPQFSDDGRHLFYVGMKTPGKYMLVMDGKEGPEFSAVGNSNTGLGILVSPDGARIAYMAYGGGSGGTGAVVEGKTVPDAARVWMSPDGKDIAYLLEPTTNSHVTIVKVVVNGKAGLEYTTLKDLRFAPDGHAVYSVTAANGKTFVVDGDKESDAYDDVDLGSLHFSADGKHTAYVATANSKSFVVLDGKRLTLPPEYSAILQPSSAVVFGISYTSSVALEKQLQFTPDGHVIYYAARYGNPSLIKDEAILGDDGIVSPDGRHVASVKLSSPGSSTSTAQVTLDGQIGPVFGAITRMTFSADSKHFAYVGRGRTPIPSGKEGGFFLVVDGAQKGEYAEISDLRYSPDSQHLFHFVTSHLNGGPGMAYMDQHLFFTFNWLPGYWAEWLGDNRTMQILGGKYDPATRSAVDANFYRVRYFLPAANRKQNTAVAAGDGTVDMKDTQRMLGNNAGAAAASASASTPPTSAAGGVPLSAANPAVSGAASASGEPAAQVTLATGTTVEIRMVDRADSGHDPAGKQYRAVVSKPVNAANVSIPQGSVATVTLGKTQSGWEAQLQSLVIKGQTMNISMGPATVMGSAQSTASSVANTVSSTLSGFASAIPSHVLLLPELRRLQPASA
jgi:hypothetical protein